MAAAQVIQAIKHMLAESRGQTVRADVVTGAGLRDIVSVVVVIVVVATAVGITSTATAYFIKRV